MSSRISKSKCARNICTNCHINTFQTQSALKEHQELCFKNEAQLFTAAPKGTIIKLKNYKNMIKCPIKIVADFECYQPECAEKRGKSTEYTSSHKPSGYDFCVVSEYKEVYKSFYESHTFDGDVAKDFVKRLIEVRDEIDKIPSKEMIFTKQDQISYNNANVCWICQQEFPEKTYGRTKGKIKIRDHCHGTGKFWGAAHSSCNLRLTEQTFIPVIFHNLKGYDIVISSLKRFMIYRKTQVVCRRTLRNLYHSP